MKYSIHKFTKITLASVYLVILAGALVRMSGSGMGCPDWPKCFGYYIPPTEESQLQWAPDREFKEGMMIIHEDALWSAKEDFTTGSQLNLENWEAYTKHSYAKFNVNHTYIEYINRLAGALSGLFTFVLMIMALSQIRKDKAMAFMAVGVVILMGLEAWLGATVVYSELEPAKITTHMLMALVIVALLTGMVFRSSKKPYSTLKLHKHLYTVLWVLMLMTLVQIFLGTQVRQFIDHQVEAVGLANRMVWLIDPTWVFYVHRSYTIAILLASLWLLWKSEAHPAIRNLARLNLVIIGLEIFTGVMMAYVDFPLGTQPIHLIAASLLLGVQFYFLFVVRHLKISQKNRVKKDESIITN